MTRALITSTLALLSFGTAFASPRERSQRVFLTPAQSAHFVISAPYPDYPFQARRARISGSGLFQMVLDANGRVSDVRVTKSTGSRILDTAAIQALRKWRFMPNTGVTLATQPISFDL